MLTFKSFFVLELLDTFGEGDRFFVVKQWTFDDLSEVYEKIEPLGVNLTIADAARLRRFDGEELTLPSETDPNIAVTIRAESPSRNDY